MAIFAVKKGNESNDGLQQRFKKQVQNLGLMKLMRSRSHFRRPFSKRMIRLRALKREEHRTQNRKRQFYSNM
ncbi:hypothetical protein COU80_00600 [Candidatus Peregrinibacteria bacterium CG10_big_fil_rev_8_21_14_0_10_55_24]|nr:MAG: hypothetical protein COU80_00600 [Candidatus Peregrinibacteria bacterium CG10_big_fil_rev_8_21_14_0_10_55_24]